jgi:autotransporter-associated beta strand protein
MIRITPRIAILLPIALLTALGSAVAAGQKIQSEAEKDDWWVLRDAAQNPIACQSSNPLAAQSQWLERGEEGNAESGHRNLLMSSQNPHAFILFEAPTNSASWLGSPNNGNWIPLSGTQNWNSGIDKFPGSTSGLTNGDTATFLISNTTTITINSPTLNIRSVIFGNSSTAPSNFTIGSVSGNPLLLTNGGEIAIAGLPSGTSGVTETINAPLILEPGSSSTSGSHGFRNSATASVTNVLNINGTVTGGTTSAGITVDLNGSNTGANTVSGVISDGGAASGLTVTKSDGGSWTLSGANTYTGGTAITGGTLKLSGSGTLGSSSGSLTIGAGATLNLGGTSQTVGALNGSGGQIINSSGSSILTVGNGGGSGSYAGSITNTGTIALTKTGAGTQTLTGINSYTGATTVNAGTLLINGSTASGSTITVNNGGTILGGIGNIGGKVNVGSGATILGGTGSLGQTLTVSNTSSGAITLLSGSVIKLALGGSGAHSTLAHTGSGTITFDGNQAFTFLDLGAQTTFYDNIITGTGLVSLSTGNWHITNEGFSGTFMLDGSGNIDLTLSAVPEPGTWAAAVCALCGLIWTQLRKSWRTEEQRFARKLAPVRIG